MIYTTGRPDALNHLQPLGPREVLLQKPFALAELVAAARRLLGHSHQGQATPMPPFDDFPDDPGRAGEERAVRVAVNGTTVMAIYQVEGAAVLLASADFGDASATLGGQAPEAVAARLLRGLAEAAMARNGARYLRDDETNSGSA